MRVDWEGEIRGFWTHAEVESHEDRNGIFLEVTEYKVFANDGTEVPPPPGFSKDLIEEVVNDRI